jgi:hypothetical protein
MNSPPSLADDILRRAFRAANGEFGFLPADANAVLDACLRDGIGVFGWELWVIDHDFPVNDTPVPEPAKGSWCGGIPCRGKPVLSIIGGGGSLEDTRRQIGSFDAAAEIEPAWLPFVRVNLTLDIIPGDDDPE